MRGLLGLLCLFGTSPSVPPPAWCADLASVRQAAATLKTMQVSFVQTRTLGPRKAPLVSRGIIAFRRPHDLRWEYQSPLAALHVVRAGHAQQLLRHGAEWVGDVSARLEARAVVLGEMMLWLDGNFAASRAFRPELRPATREQPAHVELFPLAPLLGRIIAHITVTFGERPGTISAIDIFDQGEGATHIVFEHPRFDLAIPDQQFDFPR